MLIEEVMQARVGAVDPDHPGAQVGHRHQPGDPAAAHAPAGGPQGALEPGAPVAAAMGTEQGLSSLGLDREGAGLAGRGQPRRALPSRYGRVRSPPGTLRLGRP